jgi:hypothetical protein
MQVRDKGAQGEAHLDGGKAFQSDRRESEFMNLKCVSLEGSQEGPPGPDFHLRTPMAREQHMMTPSLRMLSNAMHLDVEAVAGKPLCQQWLLSC